MSEVASMRFPHVERTRKPKQPCERCGMNATICICAKIPCHTLVTRVLLVIHAKELKRTSNTGTLALHALTNSALRIRGSGRQALDLSPELDPMYESVLFYPSSDAAPLDASFFKSLTKPVQLIVPDGSWRQAGKVHVRHQELSHLPRVMMAIPNLAKHHLRAETSLYGMSTLEAVARALGVLEGPDRAPGVEKSLLDLYQAKLQATLRARGVRDLCLAIDHEPLYNHDVGTSSREENRP